MLNHVLEKDTFEGGGGEGRGVGKGGGRAEQNSVPFETVLNFEMHFEKKKRHFRGGGVADMHLP